MRCVTLAPRITTTCLGFGTATLARLDHQGEIDSSSLHARPGCVLVAVRDYSRMEHLKKVLEKTNLRRHDIVVISVRNISSGAGEYDLSDNQERDTHRMGVDVELQKSCGGG